MSKVPSGALAGAAAAAGALAGVVARLSNGLPLAADVAASVQRDCTRVAQVSAPRVRGAPDIATIGASLVRAVQAGARAAEASDASAGLYEAAAQAGVTFPASASPVLTRQYALARALAATVEVACLGEAFVAEASTAFSDRRSATEARARIGRAMDGASDRISIALGQEVLAMLSGVARETSGHLALLATSLQPVVRVEAGRSYPSTALAWGLYGDPARAADLVQRNRCGTPLFLPASVEAIAPAGA